MASAKRCVCGKEVKSGLGILIRSERTESWRCDGFVRFYEYRVYTTGNLHRILVVGIGRSVGYLQRQPECLHPSAIYLLLSGLWDLSLSLVECSLASVILCCELPDSKRIELHPMYAGEQLTLR